MVVIDKLEALKAWLVKKLTPMCDADPSALAKYIIALVKKDKTEEELMRLCSDQLAVFLQQETSDFVSELFATLQNKSYCEDVKQIETITGVSGNDGKEEEPSEQKKSLKRRINSPDRHGSRGQYDRRRRSKRSPRSRRPRSYRSHSGSPKRSRVSPKRRRSRTRSKSPNRRTRRAKSLSSSRSPSRSPDSSHQKPSSSDDPAKKKSRCWSFDQNGFCVLGENCPHDHGKDPVVVEGSAISSTGSSVTMPPTSAPTLVPPPVFAGNPVLPQMPMMPLPPFLPPPGLHVHPLHRMRLPPPPLPPHGTMRVPPPVMPPQPPRSQPPPGYNPEAPGITYSLDHRPDVPAVTSGPPPSVLGTGGGPPPLFTSRGATAVYSSAPSSVQSTGFPKNNFNNTKLVIRKIPPLLNNITKLNEHFSKFGAINNIQVKFENDPQCALVEYAHANSARAAKRDTGAVMNNRFIVIHWFNSQSKNSQNQRGTNQQSRVTAKDRLSTLPTMSQLKYTAPGKDTKRAVQNDSANTATTNYIPGSTPKADAIQSVKDCIKPNNVDTKVKVEQEQLSAKERFLANQKIMIQKRIELQKQKRGLLDSQVAKQKVILNKIKNSKSMPPNEKVKLLEMLKELTALIDKLRTELKGESTRGPAGGKAKHRKTQLQLLDAEMDLHNASTAGDSTLGLKHKLNQLKKEASSLGLVNAFTPSWDGGRGGYVPRAKAPRMFKASANLDRRPRELRVTGFHDDEKDQLITHLARFGEIETFTFSNDNTVCMVKFQVRSQAEVASVHGSSFKNRQLMITWATGTASTGAEASLPTPAAPESKRELASESSEAEEAPPDLKNEDETRDDIDIHVGEESFKLPEEEEGGEPSEDELDEDALLSADFDDDIDDQLDDDEEIRSWRR